MSSAMLKPSPNSLLRRAAMALARHAALIAVFSFSARPVDDSRVEEAEHQSAKDFEAYAGYASANYGHTPEKISSDVSSYALEELAFMYTDEREMRLTGRTLPYA
ncbi:hypothetical protein ACH427_04485 [Streptomyces sp. NPDC020379]|uniref:hypothetical protein n=1 Tax=Streptomyces sp. NPDC020379 TaxID=3365071 RepID=UPI003793B48D